MPDQPVSDQPLNILDKNIPNPVAKNPNFFTHKVVAAIGLVLIGAILILFGLMFVFHVNLADLFNTIPATENTKVSTPSAKVSTKSAEANQTNSQTKTEEQPDPNIMLKQSEDRKAKSNVRSVATAVMSCITSELSKGTSSAQIYSLEDKGCASQAFLLENSYLQHPFDPDLHSLTNAVKKKICVYALNTSGNGTVSFDSESGVVSEAGQGKTNCY